MSWPTYLGYDLFLTEPNYAVQPKIGFATRHTIVSGIWTGYNHDTYEENPIRLAYSYLLEDITKIKDTIDFFNNKCGRFTPFFIPSWIRDVKISAAFSDTDNIITIEDIDYQTTWQSNKALGRHLFILWPDGTYVCRKIYKAITATTLQLNQAIGVACTEDEAAGLFCCFLYFVRFDIDELEINYQTLDVAECELTFQSLNLTRDGSASQCVIVTTTTSSTTTSSSTTSSTTISSTTTSSSTISTTSSTASSTSSSTTTTTAP